MSWRPTKRWVAGALVATLIAVVIWEEAQTYRELRARHDESEARIESALPKDGGIQVEPLAGAPPGGLTIVVTTAPAAEHVPASVTVQIDQDRTWTLPVPAADASEAGMDAWWLEDAEPVVAQIQEDLAQRIERDGVEAASIRAPRPAGESPVPQRLVIRLLGVLQELGVHDVAFEPGGSPRR